MNKLFTKIAALALGATMAVGVGVAVASATKVRTVYASISPTEEAGLAVLTSSNFDSSAEYVLKSTDGYYWNGVSGTSSSKWGGITKTLSDVARVTINGTWADGFTIKDASNNYLRATTGNMTWATTQPGTFKMGSDSASNPIVYNGTSNGLKVNGTSGMRLYTNLTYNASTGKSVALYKIPVAKTLSNINVKTAPTKTTYYAGEFFDPTGLELTATYSDSTTATIDYATYSSDFTFTPSTSTALTTSDVSVTIEYGGKSTTQAITVNAARTLSSIAITTAPSKTTYTEGETFSSAGMVVTATYSDSSTANVTSSCTFSPSGALTTSDDEITVSYTYSGVTKTATQAITVNEITEVTFTAGTGGDQGTASTVSKLGVTLTATSSALDDATYYKIYKNQTLTVSTSGSKNIGKIEFTCQNNADYDFDGFSAVDVGTMSGVGTRDGVWNGSSKTIVFTAGNHQVRATLIKVTFESTKPSVELDHNTLDLKTTQTAGLTVEATVHNVTTPTYSWVADNANVTLEDDDTATVTIKPNTNVAASSTVTLTVGGITPNLTATVTVTITVPGPGETPETAYSVADAMDAIDAGEGVTGVYTEGIICQIDSYSSTYHSITYWISDDGTTTTKLEVYSGKGLNNANFTSVDDLDVGGTVIVYGNLTKYNNTTYEYSSGNYLASYVAPPKVQSITLTPATLEVAPEDAGDIVDLFTNIVINQDAGCGKTVNDIVWSSADDNVFYVDGDEYLVAGEHKDSTTLYASIDGKVYGSATIEVVDPNHPFIVYDIPVEWTIVADPSTLVAGDKVILTGVKNEVTYAAGTYASGNNVPADTDNTLTVSGSNVTGVVSTMIYTLETGSETGTLAFKDSAGKYLYAAGGTNNNYMRTESTINANASFILNSDGTVVAQGASTRNYMRYNNSGTSNLFSCYASTGTTGDLVTFYKMSGGEAQTLDLDNTILSLVRSHMANYQDEHGVTQYGIAVCDYYGSTLDKNDWDDMGADFTSSVVSTYKLNYARANAAGNDVEKFLSGYDYAVEKYGASYDFLGRIASGKIVISGGRVNPINPIFNDDNANAITVVVVISVISLTAIGGYFFLRKRREEN